MISDDGATCLDRGVDAVNASIDRFSSLPNGDNNKSLSVFGIAPSANWVAISHESS